MRGTVPRRRIHSSGGGGPAGAGGPAPRPSAASASVIGRGLNDNLSLKGGFAEYAVAADSALAHKPVDLTFAEASTIPQAGAIALQGTVGAAPGRRVLVNGGGGGARAFSGPPPPRPRA